uniref:Coiled-coil domain-containing protein 147 n=1 Tax=Panagrellus redivivus TaxID=6233 RepID=A0A7E4VL52_PANRE
MFLLMVFFVTSAPPLAYLMPLPNLLLIRSFDLADVPIILQQVIGSHVNSISCRMHPSFLLSREIACSDGAVIIEFNEIIYKKMGFEKVITAGEIDSEPVEAKVGAEATTIRSLPTKLNNGHDRLPINESRKFCEAGHRIGCQPGHDPSTRYHTSRPSTRQVRAFTSCTSQFAIPVDKISPWQSSFLSVVSPTMEEDPELIALYNELNDLRLFKNKLLETRGNDRQRLRKKANSKSAQNDLARLRNEYEALQANCAEMQALAKWEKNELEKQREILQSAQQEEQSNKELHRSVAAELTTIKGSAKVLKKAKTKYNRTLYALKKAEQGNAELEAYGTQLQREYVNLLKRREKQDAMRLNFEKDSDKDFAELAKKKEQLEKKSEEIDEKYAKLQMERVAYEAKKKTLLEDLEKDSDVIESLDSKIADAKKQKEDSRLKLKAASDQTKSLKQQLREINDAKNQEAFYRKQSQQLKNEIIKHRNAIGPKKQQWRKAESRLKFAESNLEKLENNDSDDLFTSLLDTSIKIVMDPPHPSFLKQTPSTNAPPNTFAPIPRRRTPSRPRKTTPQKPFGRSGSLSRLN